mgnify:CR=1 FL=1
MGAFKSAPYNVKSAAAALAIPSPQKAAEQLLSQVAVAAPAASHCSGGWTTREQLAIWGERNRVAVIVQEGGDAAAVTFDAVAELRIIDVSCPQQMLAVMKWVMAGNRGLLFHSLA